MKLFLSAIIHILMWCGYSYVLYLSHHDHSFYESVLLVMFSYFNYLVSLSMFSNKTVALNLTIIFTSIYVVGRILLLNAYY